MIYLLKDNVRKSTGLEDVKIDDVLKSGFPRGLIRTPLQNFHFNFTLIKTCMTHDRIG